MKKARQKDKEENREPFKPVFYLDRISFKNIFSKENIIKQIKSFILTLLSFGAILMVIFALSECGKHFH